MQQFNQNIRYIARPCARSCARSAQEPEDQQFTHYDNEPKILSKMYGDDVVRC